MAGDWIKMATGLRRHPKVVAMSTVMKADKLRVVGALHAVWSVFDEHSEDGRLVGYTPAALDEEIGWKGFTTALRGVDWIVVDADGLTIPEFDEHNGVSAKRRAQDTKNKRTNRGQESVECPHDKRTDVGKMSASDADKNRTREEKRREEEPLKPRPTRLPPDWAPSDQDLAYAAEKGVDIALETEKFRNHWAAATKNATSPDWPAKWRTWVLNAASWAGRNGSVPAAKPWEH